MSSNKALKFLQDWTSDFFKILAGARSKNLVSISPVKPVREDTGIPRSIFSTDDNSLQLTKQQIIENFNKRTFQRNAKMDAVEIPSVAMDESIESLKAITSGSLGQLPWSQFEWYGNQSFIGFTLCSILAQHWLINKACEMPAEDAIRNGYEITANDGQELDAEILNEIKELDKKYRINYHLKKFVTRGRIFGIRIALFKVDYADPSAYEKPFNPDGVRPGSYRGIAQIDPYWVTPELDAEASSNAASLYFYEPTWWRINGIRYHRTHLVIMRHCEVPDLLKPTYFYGGVPLPQQIYERVYSAERTANEAPLLAMTKRTSVYHVDLSQFIANQAKMQEKIEKFAWWRDNYGVKMAGLEEEFEQFDTSLTDLDEVIMTQYQIVSAISGVPATKLLGTSPKGFNATGDFEEASYHEKLESIQEDFMTPLLERHHELLIRSEIAKKFGGKIFNVHVTWKPVDSMTAKELAEVNKMKADTGAVLVNAGAIDGNDERKRIINDADSGYNGIDDLEVNSDVSDPNTTAQEVEENNKNIGITVQGGSNPV